MAKERIPEEFLHANGQNTNALQFLPKRTQSQHFDFS